MRRRSATPARERGLSQSAQLALVWPVLLLVTLGIVQAGVWVHARNVAQRAATGAVDVARGSYGTAAQAEARARSLASAGGLEQVDVAVTRGDTEATARVTARAPLLLDLGLSTISETAAAPVERVSSP